MYFRIYLGCGILFTGLYIAATAAGVKGPSFSGGGPRGAQRSGVGAAQLISAVAGPAVPVPTWHGGK